MLFEDVVSFFLAHPEWGWLLILAFAVEQLFAPWQTKTKQLTSRVEKRVKHVEEMQLAQMTVIRALARVHDEIDTEMVDEYLEENGVSPDDFIEERVAADDFLGGDD